MPAVDRIGAFHDEMTTWRRDIHAHPELGFEEHRTSDLVAGGAFFDIDIEGVGAHGARPESSVDPVVVASHMVTAIQSVVSRNIRPTETAVVSVTRLHAGDAYNVIPQSARLGGTVRAFSVAVMELVERSLARIASGVAESYGARARLDFRPIFNPTINFPEEAEFAASICAELVGVENVERNLPPIMASEDFSFMLDRVPGCYVNLGNGDVEGACEVHNPGYDFNDEALPLGASFFARVVETRLARESA